MGPHVVVVGAGIAGLTAALTLASQLSAGQTQGGAGRAGLRVTLLEASDRVGGKVSVSEVAGVPVDAGAESALVRSGSVAELAAQVGLADALVAPATTSAQVYSRGRLHPLPARQVMGVPADVGALARTGLLTPPELARVLVDRVRPGQPVVADVAVGRFVAARLGRAVVDRLVEPLLGGVYAGHADSLSLEATIPALYAAAGRERSLLAAAAAAAAPPPARASDGAPGGQTPPARPGPAFATVSGGLGRLPLAVAEAAVHAGVDLRLGTAVRELTRTPAGWALVVGPARAPETILADAVILAVPATPAARLLTSVAPNAATLLAGIEYASVGLVTLAFDAAALPALPRGSGILVPPVEGRVVKAVTISSAKWGWYAGAAPGLVLLRLSVGRHGENADLQRDDDDLVRVALGDLAVLTEVAGDPIDHRVTRWGGGLPQYGVGHRDRVRRIREQVSRQPGLALAGAAYDGVGLPAAITTGRQAAAGVRASLAAGLGRGSTEGRLG